MPDTFPANLRRLRKSRGLTLRALAEQVGVDNSAIARMESGKSQPSLPTLVKLADVLQCSLDELCGRTVAR